MRERERARSSSSSSSSSRGDHKPCYPTYVDPVLVLLSAVLWSAVIGYFKKTRENRSFVMVLFAAKRSAAWAQFQAVRNEVSVFFTRRQKKLIPLSLSLSLSLSETYTHMLSHTLTHVHARTRTHTHTTLHGHHGHENMQAHLNGFSLATVARPQRSEADRGVG
jgi:hypothetical protein